MSAAEARAVWANLICIEQDIAADQRALDVLGRWLIRFTPIVARGWDDDADALPAVLFLDLTGCDRLFGGIDRLVDRVKQSLTHFGIPAQLAAAPTVGAAWAMAFTGASIAAIINSFSLRDAVAPLPVASLRLDETTIDNLHQLGLHRVGDVLALPRDQLAPRFGPSLLKRIDQLTGALIEPLTKLVIEPSITAAMDFEAPVEAIEDIGRIFEKLLGLILAELAARNHGVRQLRMIFKPDRGWGRSTITRTIALSCPHRDRVTLLNLIRCQIERVDCEHGFIRFQLDVPLHEPIAAGQGQLFDPHLAEEEMELERLLQRLRARLGETAVIRPELVESYLPERAWRAAQGESSTVVPGMSPLRPLTLFPTPLEIRVVCEPSDDRTGHPRQFTRQGNVHRLTHITGPERIAGQWWRGHHRTRDYYDVEDDTGRRFWLFRVLHGQRDGAVIARWFLHGRFD